jgi:lipoprotein-releasing system permease protein
MMTRLELSIAWRYLRSRRGSKLLSLISLIAIGGVTVAVSALIVIMGVMNGLQNDLREKILIGSPDIRVLTYGEDMVMTDWSSVLEKVLRQKGVVTAGPFVHTQALIQAGRHKYMEGVFVEGLPPDGPNTAQVTTIRRRATAGDFTFLTADGKHHGAVLGSKLAEKLNVTPGIDSITLMTVDPSKISAATGMPMPKTGRFEVTGIFDTGMYEYDNSYVIVALDAAQDLAQLGQAVTGLEVKTPTRWEAPDVSQRLQDSLGMPFRLQDWHQQNSSLFNALKLEKLGMGVILLLIALVAAFNIISTLIMVVTDKTKEIGILRAMGMPARSIRRVFFAQGLAIGVVGTAAGLAIGIAASVLIGEKKLIPLDPAVYFIDHLPVSTQPLDVTLIVLASLGVAALATIYPALQAARLYPVEAIRHE